MGKRSGAFIALSAAFCLIDGCGSLFGSGTASTACQNSALLGNWASSGETVSFTASCGFTSSICGATAGASDATGKSGTVDLTGWTVSGSSGCSSQANRTCTYTISGSTLTLSCTPTGGGTYTKL
jgi:hypothetical protein